MNKLANMVFLGIRVGDLDYVDACRIRREALDALARIHHDTILANELSKLATAAFENLKSK